MPDADRMPAVEPEVAQFRVDGYPFHLLAWTEDEWNRLSGDERPADACLGSKGSWYQFAPSADRQI